MIFILSDQVCLVNTETQAVSDLQVKETLAFCPSDCGSLGDQQVPSKIYSGTLIQNISSLFNPTYP